VCKGGVAETLRSIITKNRRHRREILVTVNT